MYQHIFNFVSFVIFIFFFLSSYIFSAGVFPFGISDILFSSVFVSWSISIILELFLYTYIASYVRMEYIVSFVLFFIKSVFNLCTFNMLLFDFSFLRLVATVCVSNGFSSHGRGLLQIESRIPCSSPQRTHVGHHFCSTDRNSNIYMKRGSRTFHLSVIN